MQQPQSLVSRWLRSKFAANTDDIAFKDSSNCSFIWKGIHRSKDLVLDLLRWRLGDGHSIDVASTRWVSPWHGPRGIFKVADLWDNHALKWNMNLIQSMYGSNKYLMATANSDDSTPNCICDLDYWRTKLPYRIILFGWKAINQAVPTVMNLKLHHRWLKVAVHFVWSMMKLLIMSFFTVILLAVSGLVSNGPLLSLGMRILLLHIGSIRGYKLGDVIKLNLRMCGQLFWLP